MSVLLYYGGYWGYVGCGHEMSLCFLIILLREAKENSVRLPSLGIFDTLLDESDLLA